MIQDFKVPSIDPVPEGIERPFWSVMIPTYNCADYLVKTLETVLVQDPGLEKMQIEVVDDCSTKDDPEAVVKEIGKGRVSFYRQPQNVGAIRNFNTCIERATGHLVHILHGDDYVSKEFYTHFSQVIESHPEEVFFACRTFIVDESDEIISISDSLKFLENIKNDSSSIFNSNPFRTPGIVIKRKFYEDKGGFCESLKHTADWEMWVRTIIEYGSAISINQPLAFYRLFEGNDTNKLARSGDLIRDLRQIGNIFDSKYQDFNKKEFLNRIKNQAFNLYIKFLSIDD